MPSGRRRARARRRPARARPRARVLRSPRGRCRRPAAARPRPARSRATRRGGGLRTKPPLRRARRRRAPPGRARRRPRRARPPPARRPPWPGGVPPRRRPGAPESYDSPPVWLEDAERIDVAVYAAIARTPTPSLDRGMSRIAKAADYSRLNVAAAGLLALAGGAGGRPAAPKGAAPRRGPG